MKLLPIRNIRLLWEFVRTSLWFVPTLCVVGAAALALGMVELDTLLIPLDIGDTWPRLFGVGASGARGVLEIIAGSMIGVAGVAFSITIVALTLASSQYSSRILGSFMRDRASQLVLGAFVGIFVYCLLVLRTIREGEETTFVPAAAVLIAVLLAVLGIGCLIFFIHHIATSIQAESIISAAAAETLAVIDRLFPEELGEEAPPQVSQLDDADPGAWRPLPAEQSGYLRGVDESALIAAATATGRTVCMERRIGDFVIEGSSLVSVAPAEPADDECDRLILCAFSIGRQRTMAQDALFGVRRIVDVALKALSPGVNDTTTAVACIERLTMILARLAGRRFPPNLRRDGDRIVVRAAAPMFPEYIRESFDQIRLCSSGNIATLLAMARALHTISDRTTHAERREPILTQLRLIEAVTVRSLADPEDRAPIEAAIAAARRTLGAVTGAAATQPRRANDAY